MSGSDNKLAVNLLDLDLEVSLEDQRVNQSIKKTDNY